MAPNRMKIRITGEFILRLNPLGGGPLAGIPKLALLGGKFKDLALFSGKGESVGVGEGAGHKREV